MLNKPLLFLLRLACQPSYRRFERGLSEIERAQANCLRRITGNDYATLAQIPICDWDEIKIAPRDPVTHYEPTSGSSGAKKMVPYTASLLRSFTNMFAIWAHDVLSYGPRLETGRIFISVSPLANRIPAMDRSLGACAGPPADRSLGACAGPPADRSLGACAGPSADRSLGACAGTPAASGGFSSDADYLREPLRTLVRPFLSSSLDDRTLEVISIWSPSLLLRKIEQLDVPPHEYWPQLRLISCWDNALSEPLATRLRTMFPHVQVQGKGLLLTEAPITVPIINAYGALPLVDDVFMEFEMQHGEIRLLHQLIEGEQYQVIVTQAAGLIRYRTYDLVRVTGFYCNVPKLIFVGRANQVCDLVGEKLHETFVRDVLLPLIPSGNFVLSPLERGYVLLTEINVEARVVDTALRTAYHYELARQLDQLDQVRVIRVDRVHAIVRDHFQSRGMKEGDIKDVSLITHRLDLPDLVDSSAQ